MKLRFTRTSIGLVPRDSETSKYLDKYKLMSDVDIGEDQKQTGSTSMLRTWRMWMQETAAAMRHYGCTMPMYIDKDGNPKGSRPYSADDAHAHFTSIYLGKDDEGKRKSWSFSDSKDCIQASAGDRLWAMDRHLEWCTEKGITLTIPVNSEFKKLMEN